MAHPEVEMESRAIQRIGGWLAVALLLWPAIQATCHPELTPSAPLTTDEIVERMVAMNRARAEALRSYTATCVYHVQNDNHNKSADLVVRVLFLWPNQKESTVLSESGSSVLRSHVLNRLLEEESEAMQAENRRQTDMNPQNYEFRLVSYERTGPHDSYVIEVVPKTRNKFLFQGRVWVDAEDFGIVRMEGAPAKSPSWWTTDIEVSHSYCKVGDFWLPARNETIAQVRIFGRSVLTIVYKDYKVIEAQSVRAPALISAITSGTRVAGN
jgi:hypothetical protein